MNPPAARSRIEPTSSRRRCSLPGQEGHCQEERLKPSIWASSVVASPAEKGEGQAEEARGAAAICGLLGAAGPPRGWGCKPSAGRDAAAAGTPGGVPAPLGSPREPCDGSATPTPAPFTAQTPGCGPRPPPAAYLRLLGVAAGRENQLGAGAGGCEPPHQPQPDAPAAAGDEHGAAAGLGHAGTAFSTAFSTALSALTAAPRGS